MPIPSPILSAMVTTSSVKRVIGVLHPNNQVTHFRLPFYASQREGVDGVNAGHRRLSTSHLIVPKDPTGAADSTRGRCRVCWRRVPAQPCSGGNLGERGRAIRILPDRPRHLKVEDYLLGPITRHVRQPSRWRNDHRSGPARRRGLSLRPSTRGILVLETTTAPRDRTNCRMMQNSNEGAAARRSHAHPAMPRAWLR